MIKILNQNDEHIGGVITPDWTVVAEMLPDDDISELHFDAQDLAAHRITQVREEAARRMIALTGARDEQHLNLLVSNASREAIRLLKKGEGSWSAEEAQRAAALEAMDDAIEAIRAASNALEAMSEIPEDFANAVYWP